MTRTTLAMTEALYQYYLDNSLREDPVLTKLRAETDKLSAAKMQIAPEEGQFLSFIVQLLGAKRTLDIGTFTGYSSLVVAMAMPEAGKVIACDINREWTNIAKKYWQLAGQAQKIELRLNDALNTLEDLIEKGETNSFDFAFIDADKKNYAAYYDLSVELIRPGGVIAIDNVLWDGRVANLFDTDENTQAIRNLNKKVFSDSRVFITMIPIADGLTLVRKK